MHNYLFSSAASDVFLHIALVFNRTYLLRVTFNLFSYSGELDFGSFSSTLESTSAVLLSLVFHLGFFCPETVFRSLVLARVLAANFFQRGDR